MKIKLVTKRSKPRRHTVEMYAFAAFVLTMTFTFDLWPWKRFQQLPLTWWTFTPSFIAFEIPAQSTDISCRAKWLNGQRTDRKPVYTMLSSLSTVVVGGCI